MEALRTTWCRSRTSPNAASTSNRRGFNRALQGHIAWTRRHGVTGALLILDLDNFKHQNDTYGHDAGDKVLVAVTQSLLARLRATDVIGRLGGDEFAVLLPDTSPAQAAQLTRSISEEIFPVSTDTAITASIGLVSFETLPDLTVERAMTCADRAMYAAKGRGRNQYVEYVPPVRDADRTY
jgi:diguanylate cyclase (GGDEF)-like protein